MAKAVSKTNDKKFEGDRSGEYFSLKGIMDQLNDADKRGYILFMRNHWLPLKAQGLTTSFALTHIYHLWKALSDPERDYWRSIATVIDITDMMKEITL
jgi:hypothetical protein